MRKRFALRLGLATAFLLALLAALGVAALASSADAVWPETGDSVKRDGKLVLDYSHSDAGYVMACVSSPSKRRLKMRMTYNGTQLMYDLDSSGEYEVFPLQLGSGKYVFELFENVKSSKYSAEGKVSINASLTTENAAFLVTNQYVDYAMESLAVLKSDEINASFDTDRDVYKTVCDFMKSEFTYDFVRAKTISPGSLPEIDSCFDKRSGICQDLSAVMVCMLRVQGVPAKLMIGYADKYYHAWTVAEVDGEEIFFDPTAELGCLTAKKYQTERFY